MSNPIDREVTVFGAARRLPAGERAAYLDEACAGNAELRLRVEQLLRASDEAGGFLQDPAPGAQRPIDASTPGETLLITAAPGEKAGDRIGRYKLLQPIGEGGCGVVYMAEQEEPVRRRVALKVIKLGMDTKSVVARFEAERQALALMDHPNIAKVLDAGATDTGRPYFVMELVRGIKITQYCDENNLATKERLDLFIQVAQAVQHAHQKGIIHRDLKPSNIMVADHDGVPVPKIIDFGIAKATTDQRLTDKTLFTAFEQFIGTPAYMSPEQARMSGLDVDTRTDIYSLGVLLYELLTGKTPFDAKELLAAGLDEMRRTISEKEPARPSTRLGTMLEGELTTTAKHRHTDAPKLVHLIRGDLDWIVMKALEKDRARRYETANGLAMDVQRYLADEAVVARPPGNLYRFQKLARRNKLAFAAAGAVAAALLIGMGVSTWLLVKEKVARQRAVAAEKKAQTEAIKSQHASAFLKKMLEGVGPSFAQGRDPAMLREILDATARSVGTDLTNEPEVQIELYLTLAATYHDLALYQQEEDIARESLRLARASLGEENESVADSLYWIGRAVKQRAQARLGQMHTGGASELERYRRRNADDMVEAEKYTRACLAMRQKLLGNEDPNTAEALERLAEVLGMQYESAEAEKLHREVLAIYRKQYGSEHVKTARALRGLAATLSFEDETRAQAVSLTREALAIERRLQAGDHPGIARALVSLGIMLKLEGKSADAETALKEGVAMWRRLKATERLAYAEALLHLAESLSQQDKAAEAETVYREMVETQKKLCGPEHPEVARSLGYFAHFLYWQDRLAEAETLHREALGIAEKLPEREQFLVAEALGSLVYVLQKQNKLDAAATACREVLEFQRKRFGYEHPALAGTLSSLAQALEQQGKLAEAETAYRDALALRRKSPERERAYVAWSLQELARFFEQQGRLAEAETEYREALEIVRKQFGNESVQAVESVYNLALLLKQQGKPEAETFFGEAVEHMHVSSLNSYAWQLATGPDPKLRNGAWAVVLGEKAVAATSRTNHLYLDSLAAAYAEAGQFTNAVRAQREAIDIAKGGQDYASRLRLYQSENPYRDPAQAEAMLDALLTQRKFTEAERIARDCLALSEKQFPNAWETFSTRALLGSSLVGQKKIGDGEQLMLSGYEDIKQLGHQLPNGLARLADIAGRLVQLYESTGRAEQVAEWKKRQADAQANALAAREAASRRASGLAHAQHGRFSEAATEFGRGIELVPGDHRFWRWQAPTLVQSGQLAAYRELRRKAVERFGETTDFSIAERISRGYTILPSTEAELEIAVKMADKAVSAPTNHPDVVWFRLAKGVAEYRQGHFASAADWMQKVLSTTGAFPERDAEACLVLAMAQHQLQQTDQAHATLARGRQIIDQKLPKLESSNLGDRWIDWVIAHAFLAEAKALMQPTTAISKE